MPGTMVPLNPANMLTFSDWSWLPVLWQQKLLHSAPAALAASGSRCRGLLSPAECRHHEIVKGDLTPPLGHAPFPSAGMRSRPTCHGEELQHL